MDHKEEMLPLIEHNIREREPYEPDMQWGAYEAMEQADVFFLVIAWRDGRIVGYASFFLSPAMHQKGRFMAQSEAIYLKPSQRKGFNAVRMLRYAERKLRERGVTDIFAGEKKDTGVSVILKRLGYEMMETVYSKKID